MTRAETTINSVSAEMKKNKPFCCVSIAYIAIFCYLFVFNGTGSLYAAGNSSSETVSDSLEIERLTSHLRTYMVERRLDDARLTIDSIMAVAILANMQQKVGDCYYNHALVERTAGNRDGFAENLRKAIEIYKKEKAWWSAARAKTLIAQQYVSERNYTAALYAFSESLMMRKVAGDSLGMANNLINMGNICFIDGRMAEAGDYFYRAMRITDDLENNTLKATVLKNMSNVHMRQRQYNIALDYLQQALEIHRTSDLPEEKSDVLMNTGIVYYKLDSLETAKQYLEQSLEIKLALQTDLPDLINIYNNLGVIAHELGDNDTAIQYYASNLEVARQINDRQAEAFALNNLGSRKMAIGDTTSLSLLNESLDISRNLGLKKLVLTNYDNLQQYHSRFGNFERAYDYSIKYRLLNDSIFNEESAATILELQTQYDTEMKEKENELLRNQASIQQLRIVILTISAGAIALIAVLFIILFGLKSKSLRQTRLLIKKEKELNEMEREKNQQEYQHLQDVLFAEEQINRLQKEQINQKNKKLSASTLHIINKNELLNNIRKIARDIAGDNNQSITSSAEQLIEMIDNNINLDEQWDQFKVHFESVHTAFFKRLTEHSPNLTHNELKLAAYLRMNLSSKEIAQMLNISIESATTKRYRLRKKFKLNKEENLVAFLGGF